MRKSVPPCDPAQSADALAGGATPVMRRLAGWPLLAVGWFPWWWLALVPPATLHNTHLLWIGVAGYPVWWGGIYAFRRAIETNWPKLTRVPFDVDPGGIRYVPPATALRFVRPLYAVAAALGAMTGWLVLLVALAEPVGT